MSLLSSGLGKIGISKSAQKRLLGAGITAAASAVGLGVAAPLISTLATGGGGTVQTPSAAVPGVAGVRAPNAADDGNVIRQELVRVRNRVATVEAQHVSPVVARNGELQRRPAPVAGSSSNKTWWIVGGVAAAIVVLLLVVLAVRK